MGRPIVLEDFSQYTALASPGSPQSVPVLPEEQRLAAFEQGYKAGWDDAATAQSEETGNVSADLAGNLRDLSFTYHEARAHVLTGIEPLLREIVASVLPEIAARTLPDLVLERLDGFLKAAAEPPVILMVAPTSRHAIEAILPNSPGFPVIIREEPTLADGQVFLRAGQMEEAIDTSSAITTIQTTIDDFFTVNEGLEAHG